MPTIEEQKEAIRKMLASSPEAWIIAGAFRLTHSSFTEDFYATDHYPSLVANDEDGTSRTWLWVPIEFEMPGPSVDLASEITFTCSDLNTDGTSLGLNIAIGELMDLIPDDSSETVKLTLFSYISYPDGTISDIADGPYELEVTDISFTETGVSFTAKSPDAVYASCGEIYTVKRFPFLRQYL